MIEVSCEVEKKTKKPVMLVLCAKNAHPWLDPIRFIQLFVRVVGHLSGCLFAPCETLEYNHDH